MAEILSFPTPYEPGVRVGDLVDTVRGVGTVTDCEPPLVAVRFNTYDKHVYRLDEVEKVDD